MILGFLDFIEGDSENFMKQIITHFAHIHVATLNLVWLGLKWVFKEKWIIAGKKKWGPYRVWLMSFWKRHQGIGSKVFVFH